MANSNWAARAVERLNAGGYSKPEPLTFTKEQMEAAFKAGYEHAHAEEQLRKLMARPLVVTDTIPRRDYGGGKHK